MKKIPFMTAQCAKSALRGVGVHVSLSKIKKKIYIVSLRRSRKRCKNRNASSSQKQTKRRLETGELIGPCSNSNPKKSQSNKRALWNLAGVPNLGICFVDF